MTKVETAKRDKYMVALLTSSTKAEAYKAAHISKATAKYPAISAALKKSRPHIKGYS